ncbi:hypothetical protein TWF106_004951 [Orbilia oligospora]|uniref:Opioid growth factor receptor (OGFr) conserved domain-containing protein n=1 Tax=Orbilia oligospora TaxID=2813651 RepID=A0A6G1LWC6_ORBOL|nr:hypothetical protein TWF788_006293 [Orbilia oligospora]KAF3196413.1 hypothetical protein TWF106_004951 [Orbilia oligospora]KAF3200079.1 hypothetical protein TWF679_001068 [Orbilia oligospora]KAF3235209.1 hypothetical protein TWF192_000797 [Orbilia oligospora]
MDLTEPSLEPVEPRKSEQSDSNEPVDHLNAAAIKDFEQSSRGATEEGTDQTIEDISQADLQTKKDLAGLSPVLRFYKGDNIQGRTLEEILEWSDSKLEYTHDFIQMLFPIPERSNFMLHPAATLDEQTIEAFRNDPELQASMRMALARMLRFFGFDYQIVSLNPDTEGATASQRLVQIVPNPETFPRAARNWMNSHNDLRITRIIRCLRCCGMETEARDFYRALRHLHTSRTGHPRKISDRTFMYWTRAAKRDLRIPPDMSDAEAERFGGT